MSDKQYTWEEAVLWLKSQPDKRGLVGDCFYDDPPHESAERYYQSTEWKSVRNLLGSTSKGKVLDIGAGRGISTYSFAKDGWQVTALEPDPSSIVGTGAIKQLQKPGLQIEISEDYGETLPFPDDSFDLIYGRAVLHHAIDLSAFCKEAKRVLKITGMFLFTREHVISKKEDLGIFFDNHPLHFLYKGENAYLLSEYLHFLSASGLICKKVLAPYSSDINLFPNSQNKLFESIRGKKRIPWPDWFIRIFLLPGMNKSNDKPGRLYSFMGIAS